MNNFKLKSTLLSRTQIGYSDDVSMVTDHDLASMASELYARRQHVNSQYDNLRHMIALQWNTYQELLLYAAQVRPDIRTVCFFCYLRYSVDGISEKRKPSLSLNKGLSDIPSTVTHHSRGRTPFA